MAGDCDIATACGADPCKGKTMMELRTCLADCAMKVQTCVATKLDAAKMTATQQIMDAKMRFMAAQTELMTKMADWKTKIDALKMATPEQLKMACNAFCTAHKDDLTADQQTKCTMNCDSITDLKTGMQAASNLVMAGLRAKYQKILEEHPEEAANLMTAVKNLQDAIGVQRAFLSDAQQKLAAAIDAKRDQLAQARQEREDAIQAFKDKFAAWKAMYDAADADGKAALLESGKMMLKAAQDAAKAKWEAAKMAWAENKMAAIQKVIAFRMERKANRKIIIADLKNVKGALADLRAACQAVDGSCQVEPANAATTTVMMKRADAATNAYVVVGCEKLDATCDLAVNTMLAGAVDTEADVTVTETTADETTGSLPTFPDDNVTTKAGTAAGTTAATKKTSSASTVVISALAVVVAVLAL